MLNYNDARAILADIQTGPATGPSDLRKSWIGKALKWSAAGVTFTLTGIDVFGNVVFTSGVVDPTLAAEAVLIETLIGGATQAVSLDQGILDSAVQSAGGLKNLAPKVAAWIIDDITGGTIALQSAPVTSAVSSFPHTHGAIVDYDLGAVTDGDKIGFGGDF
jgi:hypothetical protein